MGAVLLRAQSCLNCGGAMPSAARIDRRYCKASCRTLAYRIRRRSGMAPRPRVKVPEWVEGQPPTIASALAALAELQARVLHIAHHIEQDDIAFRHACPTKQQDKDEAAPVPVDTAALESRIEELERELQRSKQGVAEANEAREAVTDRLRRADGELQRLHAEVEQAKERADVAEKRQFELDEHLTGVRDLARDRHAKIVELSRRLEDAEERAQRPTGKATRAKGDTRQRDAYTTPQSPGSADPTVMQELGRLQGENKTLHATVRQNAHLAEELRDAVASQSALQANNDALRDELRELRRGAAASTATIERLATAAEKTAPLRQTVRDQKQQLGEAERENAALQAQVEKLKPPPQERDPLTIRMRDKIRILQKLVEYQREGARLGVGSVIIRRLALPTQVVNIADERAVWAAAIQMALETRRNYIAAPPPFATKPAWVHVNHQLDPASETALLKELENQMQLYDACARTANMRLRTARGW